MPNILIENVNKTFNDGKVTALKKMSLEISDGEYVFILGPSGCGKTTLLRIISGLEKPTIGKIYIDGIDVTQEPPQKRGIAFVFQNFEIFPLSVWENCVYALKVQGYPEEYIIKQGENALKIVGLLDRADEMPINWGNGDLQRLGIARAICSGAKILIMDEPLGSLDPKISAEFRWELRHIIKDNHLTAIQVTHNQEEAMAIGDHIIIMRNGEIIQHDKPELIYKFPNSIFAGNFLGGLNILEGYVRRRIDADNYEIKIRLGGPEYQVTNVTQKFSLDENVIIAFRYENVYLFKTNYDFENSEADWTGIMLSNGTVKDKYLTGKEKFYIIEMDNGDTLKVRKPEIFQYDFDVGETIEFGMFSTDLLLIKYPSNLQKELELQ
jgi:ABC-type Fe3+/spermidine/putrescine transport system ATPase subunit